MPPGAANYQSVLLAEERDLIGRPASAGQGAALQGRFEEGISLIGKLPRNFANTAVRAIAEGRRPTTQRGRLTMSDIITEQSGGVLRVELNRPARKNAMTGEMYVTLADAFTQAANEEAVRVVPWHGAGGDFSAGNDIGEFLKGMPASGEIPQGRLMEALIAFDKPIVAAVQGAAIGGGTTMLTHCDFVYAGESAKFQMPFVNLGLVPEFGSSFSVPSNIGHLRAAELILLGDPFTATRAMELGLVTQVVGDRDVFATAAATAQKLAAKPSGALRASKRLMKQAAIGPLRQAVRVENEVFVERLGSAEAKEAFSAFLEKRPPNFARPPAVAATH